MGGAVARLAPTYLPREPHATVLYRLVKARGAEVIRRMNFAGGNMATVAVVPNGIRGFGVDPLASTVYWAPSNVIGIQRDAVIGGAVSVFAPNEYSTGAMVFDAAYAYWRKPTGPSVLRQAK